MDSLPSQVSSNLLQPDILCFSHLRWHFVTQRPQHLLTRASATHRVFYWEEPVWHAAGELPLRDNGELGLHLELIEESPSLWVVKPHITWGIDFEAGQRVLLDQLLTTFAIEWFIRWYYTPMAFGFSAHLHAETTVYDCMDELAGFLGAPPDLIERERRLFSAADVVFTGGVSLYEAKRLQHGNVHAQPSSIDVAHFAQAKTTLREAVDQASIPHPRAGFYGVVDERFDIELLTCIATLRPTVHFIVLGPVVKIDPASLPQAANIHYLGSKTYQQLPGYLSGWDVALLPFALNDATRFISPTKTPEYLAAGKPVVSTPIRDVIRGYGDRGLVAIASTAQEFALALDRALEPQTQAWRDAVTRELAESSWDTTWASMQHEIDRVERRPAKKVEMPRVLSKTVLSMVTPSPNAQSVAATRSLSKGSQERFDYLVVGAGFSGSVIAERIATQLGKRVLLIDKRDHVAGNAYDYINADGLLVHKYGPHIFHTNSDSVVTYLSRFTAWRPYEHRVLASVDNQLLPVPINLDTINRLYNLSLDAEGMRAFLAARVETPREIRTSEDIVVSRVGRELFEKFFRGYTRKQWGLEPSQLDASVAGRIPVRFDRDDRYFTDSFQAMPLEGYTRMFERIVDHPLITVRKGVDYRDLERTYSKTKVVYTGPIDEYFGFRFGPLPYLSLEFKHETHDREVYQAAPVVNYPNDHTYTRVTEFKYLTGQRSPKTSIVYEYPRAEGDPYYPIPRPENAALYAKYRDLAERTERVHFCGRLGSYRYLNMDQVVAQAFTTFRQIAEADMPAVALTSPVKTSSGTAVSSTVAATAMPSTSIPVA